MIICRDALLGACSIIAGLTVSSQSLAAAGRLPVGVTPLAYDITVTPDAAKLTFSGSETITIDVARATNVITLNAADLAITSATLDGAVASKTETNDAAQTLSVRFAAPIKPGRHTLALRWSGKINQSAAGLFAVDYKTVAGKDARMLVTQFEAPDARRFAPMWDEPGLKATFKLSAVSPDGQTAFSNMPLLSKEASPGGGILWHFAETPKMSSYLLFLGMGDVERKTVMSGKTEIGIISRRGVSDQGDYALAAAQKILVRYNDYFGTPYPLPKLDMIAAPGSSQFFGAMENWGAILYFEPTLLIDPALETESRRQRVFTVVAHEMAHQWFGDLVTMSWWDDLWLNEGFASWMESKVSNDLNPEWHTLTQNMAQGRQGAMGLDARATTHPIVRHVETVDQISQAFDSITYQKGEAVIRMLEDSVGEVPFRAGVRGYMAKHAYGNTVTSQLWDEVGAASGKPVAAIMAGFTSQGGVPMIKVSGASCINGATNVTLSQSRFGLDAASKAPLTWQVPVKLGAVGSDAVQSVIVSGAKPVVASIPGCGAFTVNRGQSGYFRTFYDDASFAKLKASFATLSLDDQIGLLADSYYLANGDYTKMDRFLGLASVMPSDAPPLTWAYLTDRLGGISQILKGAPGRSAYHAKAAAILHPVFEKIGWVAKPAEAPGVALLREGLIPTLSEFGDASISADAVRYTQSAAANPASVPSDITQTALTVFARNATPAQWDELHGRAKAALSPVAKQLYYNRLASVADETLAKRALAIALTDEVPVPMRASIIAAVSGEFPDMAFDWAVAHQKEVDALLEASTKAGFIVGLTSNSSNGVMADKVEAFAAASLAPKARADAVDAASQIRYFAGLRQRHEAIVAAWAK